MSNDKEIEINDMVITCKRCGDGHFPSNINKDGLCPDCASGKKKAKPITDDCDDFDGW